ncbi:MAG: protoporphyrinogen oxidase [Thermomicrobium sp.]|nr:protoporphyrinogen oxidase [Thermomicrobium sp.]MDW8059743.1 protoporphyrinogen oxidase [Thermomicrobium sp.]
MTRRIAVIGGGIAGLAACWELERSAPDVEIVLLEATGRLGGWIRTESWGDVVIEHGPDSWVAAKPSATDLACALGLGTELVGLRLERAGTGIVCDGRILPLPEGLSLLVPTRLAPILASPLLTPLGKLRFLAEIFVPPRCDDEDESVASFVRRRFGREFYERLAEPLLAGIYGGDAERLSLLATSPQYRELERDAGSLLRAVLRGRARRPAMPGPLRTPFVTLRKGMERLVEALAASLRRTEVRLGTVAVAIVHRGGVYRILTSDGTALEVDGAVVATPAAAAADLLEPLFPDEVVWFRSLPYASSAAVTLVYRREDLERVARGRGFLVPARERRPISAVTWVTNKFPERAPEDLAVARVFFRSGRHGYRDEAVPEALVAAALQELRVLTGCAAAPLHAVVSRHDRALPQYPVGHRRQVERLRSALARWPGLAVAGAAFDGVGVPDCIVSGWRAARAVLDGLGTRRASHADPAAQPLQEGR